MVTVQGSVVNGWNKDFEVDAWKTIGLSRRDHRRARALSSSGRPTSARKARLSRAPRRDAGDLRFLRDLVGGVHGQQQPRPQPEHRLQQGVDDVAETPGRLAPMARYVVSDQLNLAARFEFLARQHGAHDGRRRAVKQDEITVTLGIGRGQELRAPSGGPRRLRRDEPRPDFSQGGTKNRRRHGRRSRPSPGSSRSITS